MLSCPECAVNAVPVEYRPAVEGLFPPVFGQGPTLEAAAAFAEILGIASDHKRHLEAPGEDLAALLDSFRNNLELLIQKTWVEKSEETRKEKLLGRVTVFIDLLEKGDYLEGLTEYGSMLEELAWLFFGAQSAKDDFTEYTFRIDSQMGLFWYYGSRIAGQKFLSWAKGADKKILFAILLLGICYLTNF